jgi:hypothetical protein
MMNRTSGCLLAAAVIVGLLSSPAPARTRPDQVLVIYNKDWTQDLDGSDPGQDSEELARYYVRRRTDKATGLKPYLLGLSSGNPKNLALNGPVLKETSSDNWLGLEYKGKGDLRPSPWPLTKRGEVAVEIASVVSARTTKRFAVAILRKESFGVASPKAFEVAVTPEGGKEQILLSTGKNAPKHEAVSVARINEGLLVAADLATINVRKGSLRITVTLSLGDPIELHHDFVLPERLLLPEDFVKIDRKRREKMIAKTGFLDGLVSQADMVSLLARGALFGIRVPKKDLETIDPKSLVLSARPLVSDKPATILYRDGQPATSGDVGVYRLKTGDLLLSAGFARVSPDPLFVRISARKNDGTAYTRDLALYNPSDFAPSATGADGIRDDQTYLDLIENPIKAFLENTRTADGKLLKDHILYIVVVRGLPLQVRSLYGIERGSPSIMRRGSDHGSGSALTQRLRMLYYDITKVAWRPGLMMNGKRNGIRIPSVAHPLRACMTGRRFNPYMHPLTHNKARRQRVWSDGKLEAMKQLRPTPFSTAYRATAPVEKFLYAAMRIDALDMATAKAQIDGALYGEAHLTPAMGPVYYGPYQEAPLAAKLMGEMGFDVKPIPPKADRAVACFGVFGFGASYAEQVGTGKALECVWLKGFYPGSTGIAIRSWLGWDHKRPPTEIVKLFEQIVRGGVTVTAGSAGGSHDTNLSWWDSYILHYLLLTGYELGDATLRSMIYQDWTVDMIGDPLYRPDLSKTKPDTAAPEVAEKDGITIQCRPCGGGKFALDVRAVLSNAAPEMAEIRVTCRPKGMQHEDLNVVGENTHYSASPRAVVIGLEPDTEYKAQVELIDPYGNRFDGLKAFGPISFATPQAPKAAFSAGRGVGKSEPLRIPQSFDVPNGALDASGEVHIWFTMPKDATETVPVVSVQNNRRLMEHYRGVYLGGARLPLSINRKPACRNGRKHHLVLRWRRFPVTREVVLVNDETGVETIVTTANNLPWDPAVTIGNVIKISGRAEIHAIEIKDDPAAAPASRRGPFVKRFDAKAYYGESE